MAKAFEMHLGIDGQPRWSAPSVVKDIREGRVDANPPSVISFTGADWLAGSRVVCAHVAKALAIQTEMPVCLVDANIQRPEMPRAVTSMPGLAEALLQPDQVREAASHVSGSLWTLSSNRNAEEILPLLTSSRFSELMNAIRSAFRYALITCPPIGSEPAAIPMCAAADTTVLVIGSKSKRADGERAMRVLNSMRIPTAGAVLEKLPA
jgi:Mrp family chromosome partitioning ATPase